MKPSTPPWSAFVPSRSSVLLVAALLSCGADGGAAPQQSAECLRNAPNTFVTTIDAAGLAAHDGKVVHLLSEMKLSSAGSVRCQARAETTIAGGRFAATLVNYTDAAAYPETGAFIDLDGDGSCDAGVDLIWSQTASFPPTDRTVTSHLTLDDFGHDDPLEMCARIVARVR